MRHAFSLGATDYEVWLARTARGLALRVADPHAGGGLATGVAVSLEPLPAGGPASAAGGAAAAPAVGASPCRARLRVGERDCEVWVAVHGDEVYVNLDGETWALRHRHPLVRAAAEAHSAADDEARAPMPGTVVAVQARAGDAIERGHALVVIESMKLETTVSAWRDGVVREVHVAPGQTFERDALLVTLEPQA